MTIILFSIPAVNAQNVHGWEWGVSVGDTPKYRMIIDVGDDIYDMDRNIYINITALSNITTTTQVGDISVSYEPLYTDYSEIEFISFESMVYFPVALPIGNWDVISENADNLAYTIIPIDLWKQDNGTHFSVGLDMMDISGSSLNASWYKQDGSLALYNVTMSGMGQMSLMRLDPPPTGLDIVGLVMDNQLVVIGGVAAIVVIALIAKLR